MYCTVFQRLLQHSHLSMWNFCLPSYDKSSQARCSRLFEKKGPSQFADQSFEFLSGSSAVLQSKSEKSSAGHQWNVEPAVVGSVRSQAGLCLLSKLRPVWLAQFGCQCPHCRTLPLPRLLSNTQSYQSLKKFLSNISKIYHNESVIVSLKYFLSVSFDS